MDTARRSMRADLLAALFVFQGIILSGAQTEAGDPPRSAEPNLAAVPGAVIAHSPASSGVYLGSPGIAALPSGEYLAKCDEFGPGSTEFERAVTRVYRSSDQGRSWDRLSDVNGLFWASIFTLL